MRRVVLLGSPTMLGWEHWREVDTRHGLGLLKEGLREAMEEGAIGERPLDPVAHLLVGAMNKAGCGWPARGNPGRRCGRPASSSTSFWRGYARLPGCTRG